jgi:mono/diheme cytochrome c family protein
MGRLLLLLVALATAAAGAYAAFRPPPPQALKAAAAPPPGQTAAARGRLVYARYGCASCHGADGKGGFANTNAETEGKVPAVVFVAEGFTRPELRRKILDGFATVGKKDPQGPRPPYRMPGWAGQMTDAEVGDLVEFLWSLYPKSESQKWR